MRPLFYSLFCPTIAVSIYSFNLHVMESLKKAINEQGEHIKLGDLVELTNCLTGHVNFRGIIRTLNNYAGHGANLIATLEMPNGNLVVKTLSSAKVI